MITCIHYNTLNVPIRAKLSVIDPELANPVAVNLLSSIGLISSMRDDLEHVTLSRTSIPSLNRNGTKFNDEDYYLRVIMGITQLDRRDDLNKLTQLIYDIIYHEAARYLQRGYNDGTFTSPHALKGIVSFILPSNRLPLLAIHETRPKQPSASEEGRDEQVSECFDDVNAAVLRNDSTRYRGVRERCTISSSLFSRQDYCHAYQEAISAGIDPRILKNYDELDLRVNRHGSLNHLWGEAVTMALNAQNKATVDKLNHLGSYELLDSQVKEILKIMDDGDR